MKLRNVTRLGALALTLTMVTTCLLGGTLAKYTTTVSGTDTVTVARFGYEANDGVNEIEFTTGTAVDIDLFDNLTTDATGTIASDSDNEADSGADAEYNMMLAPGAYGSFDIELNGYYSDVDIEMIGSTVTASRTGEASINGDKFISYKISYLVVDTTTETVANDETLYDVERTTMSQFASDLESVLAAIILEKNTVGTITVQYAWVDTSGEETDYSAQDTALAQGWTGVIDGDYAALDSTTGNVESESYVAPTFTLTIKNVASQIVTASDTAPDYTTSVTYANSAYSVVAAAEAD